jgi:nicotinamidase-related amidase
MRLIQHQMSQLLIVDIQNKVLELIHNQDSITSKAGVLIQSATVLRIPVIATALDAKQRGEIAAPLGALLGPTAATFDKLHFSALRNERVRDLLDEHRDHGRGQVVVAGLETHIAVLQTSLDLISEGFEVYVVADAVGSRIPASQDIALRRLERSGAHLVDAEMVVSEWLEKVGTPDYNSLSALMK